MKRQLRPAGPERLLLYGNIPVVTRIVAEDSPHPLGGFKRTDLPRGADKIGGQEGKIAQIRPDINKRHPFADMGKKERLHVFLEGAVVKELTGALFREDDSHLRPKESGRLDLASERRPPG
jgi:hypothetical protein